MITFASQTNTKETMDAKIQLFKQGNYKLGATFVNVTLNCMDNVTGVKLDQYSDEILNNMKIINHAGRAIVKAINAIDPDYWLTHTEFPWAIQQEEN